MHRDHGYVAVVTLASGPELAGEKSAYQRARRGSQTSQLPLTIRPFSGSRGTGGPGPAPQPHQIERGTAGKHGESRGGWREPIRAVRAGQRPPQLQEIAASQAEGSRAVVTGPAVVACSGRRHKPIAWLGPVGVQRDTHVRSRSTHPPSWLTFVG